MDIVSVTPVRLGSKRIPNKNYQKIGSYTLLERKIKQLKKVPELSRVIVGSNDKYLQLGVNELGAEFYLRPEIYCDEKSSSVNDMIRNLLSFFESEYVLFAHCTNPNITEKHYSDAIKQFQIQQEFGFDSLFSVNTLEGHFWVENNIPINYSPMLPIHTVAKNLPKIYSQNGGIFIRKHEDMKKDGSFLGKFPYMYKMNSIDGIDIDYPEDLEYAKFLNGDYHTT